MEGVQGFLDQKIAQAKEFCHDIPSLVEGLDPFKVAPEGTSRGDKGTSSSGAEA